MLPVWPVCLILRSVNPCVVAHSVESARANPNKLKVPFSNAKRHLNDPDIVSEMPVSSGPPWPPEIYDQLVQPDTASLVPANSVQHWINLSVMTVDNLVSTLGWTKYRRSIPYKYDCKTLFFFILLLDYHFYIGHCCELQFCDFLVRAHPTFSYLRFSVFHQGGQIGYATMRF